MWGRRTRAEREPFTYLHRGTVLEGDLWVEGRLRVDGTVRGDVRAEGPLDVGSTGSMTAGRIRASEVRILGDVQGDVHAVGTVHLWRGSRLTGDVFAAQLDIEEGATFTGRSHMPGAAGADDDEAEDPDTASTLALAGGAPDGA